MAKNPALLDEAMQKAVNERYAERDRREASGKHARIRSEAIAKGLLPSSDDWPAEQLQTLSDLMHGRDDVVAGRGIGPLRDLSDPE